eukprot:COSAG04_NODE_4926_length_1821_cov_3.380372_1_plen_307_part_10
MLQNRGPGLPLLSTPHGAGAGARQPRGKFAVLRAPRGQFEAGATGTIWLTAPKVSFFFLLLARSFSFSTGSWIGSQICCGGAGRAVDVTAAGYHNTCAGTLLGSMAFEGPPHRTPVVGGTREAADQPRYMSAEWLAQRQPLDQAYLACAESSPREGVPRGRVKSHHGWAPAGGSSAYPETRRELYIYTPPGIDAAQVRAGTQPPPHLLVFQDGPGYLAVQDGGGMNVPTVLDNMLADGEIEPTVGVFLSPGVPNAISDEDQALTGVDPQTLSEDERPPFAAAMKRIEQWARDSPYSGQRSFEYDSVT